MIIFAHLRKLPILCIKSIKSNFYIGVLKER